MSPESPIPIRKPAFRSDGIKLNITIIGAGLSGLGLAISTLLSGHRVLVLESAQEITTIGAGIQVLPNASRILSSWGINPSFPSSLTLAKHTTFPSCVNFNTWTGPVISSMNFAESAAIHGGRGTGYWDFHRADLHAALLTRARELGAVVRTGCKATDILFPQNKHDSQATVVLESGERIVSDLVVGADGINSRMRQILLSKTPGADTVDAPIPSGDMAYRLLLPTAEIRKDPDLAPFVTHPQVNYWLGPGKHAVNYVIRGGEFLNMVLLVPDDVPHGSMTMEGEVREMRRLFEGWDPRIEKLLQLCEGEKITKWKLCARKPLRKWSHSSGRFVLIGDAVHAMLPYLASGAGMCFEDAEVLGLCLGRMKGRGRRELVKSLEIYERVRKGRTEELVKRGDRQKVVYHFDDGEEQKKRDRWMREEPGREGEALAWRDAEFATWLFGYDCGRAVGMAWAEMEGEAEVHTEREERKEEEKKLMARL